MATQKVGEFTLTPGSPPEPTRTSKYDELRDAVLKSKDWLKVSNNNGSKVKVEGIAQTLRQRYGKELEVITRNGELWVRPLSEEKKLALAATEKKALPSRNPRKGPAAKKG